MYVIGRGRERESGRKGERFIKSKDCLKRGGALSGFWLIGKYQNKKKYCTLLSFGVWVCV